MKIRFFTIILLVLAAIPVYAGSISCSTATSLVPDGRLLDFDSVQANTGNWYQFTAIAGRSYSVEVRDDLDPDNSDLTVTYYTTGSCPLPNSYTSFTDTHTYEPVVPASTKRVSIVTSSAGGGTYWIKVQNGSTTTSHYVSVGVTETTIYSPAWTTQGSPAYTTQWILLNTTSQSITYTITLTATFNGSQTYSYANATLGPLTNKILNTSDTSTFSPVVNLNQGGYSIVIHNGPPGAVQPYEVEYNFGFSSPSLIPIPIGPMRGK